jgi:hypothetical protein
MTRATYLTVMVASFIKYYFIPNNFDINNDNPLSLFQIVKLWTLS